MVKEREAPAATVDLPPTVPKALQDLTSTSSPEFGKSSPLRNPLQKARDSYSHLFNVPRPHQARPEHHRAPQPPQQPPPPNMNPGGMSHPFKKPQNLQPSSGVGAKTTDSDILEISSADFRPRQSSNNAAGTAIQVPRNPAPYTIQPAPRPVYSTIGYSNGFQPVDSGFQSVNQGFARPPTNAFALRPNATKRDSDDEFDPDAALREDRDQFGAPDPFMYVDQGQANENIKALLEGAFDEEDEKIPRTRGRKKRRQQQEKEQEEATNVLAQKLQALEVKQKEEVAPAEEEDEDEEDDGSVEGMNVKLLTHQVDGVAWMTDKEIGTRKKNGVLPKGGILADDMGLGKTIQSIALILSNPRPEKDAPPENPKNKILPAVGKGTLIVAPLALIKQWESEINTKVLKSHSLRVLVHHGPSRTKSIDTLKKYDVVITTYQILSSEHASCGEGPDGLKKGCFGVHWYRIILDEAHTIKNRNAKMTKASYELRSHYRWCLTGTPMQNNLDELQSLIHFLRIKPYENLSNWKDSITNPMKNGRGGLAMKRLQYFLKACMKRRTKDILKKDGALNFGGKAKTDGGGMQIVERNIETIIGEFTPAERRFYDRLANRAEDRLAEMMGAEKQDYIGALVLLLRLRQACNHPDLTKSNVKNDKDALTTGSGNRDNGTQTPRKSRDTQDQDVDDIADMFGGLSVQTKRCDVCQTKLHRGNSTNGGIRCDDCEADLNASSQKASKEKKYRKHRHKAAKSKKHRHAKKKEDADSERQKLSKQRRVILDSDDEDEGEGDWIVPKGQQDVSNISGAHGTDDENADGGGDWVQSDDSEESDTEDEVSPSGRRKDDSFISHDTDDDDGSPVVRHHHKKRVVNLISDGEDEADSDSSSEEDEDSESEADSEDSKIEYNASHTTPSTKIRQLLQILEKETPDHKVIVFSQFTSMLDLVEPFLRRNGYRFTRYDGSMRNDLREASLHKLRNDKRTRVLLCSLKCGSLGLNLTAASRVVIMEPFWNPFVEEQAIDRVHRLNQTVNVTVYKLSILNSVEERIIDLQEAKRKLAEAAIEGGKAVAKLSMKDILNLFKRDAEHDPHHEDHSLDHEDLFDIRRILHKPVVDSGPLDFSDIRTKKKASVVRSGRVEDGIYGRR